MGAAAATITKTVVAPVAGLFETKNQAGGLGYLSEEEILADKARILRQEKAAHYVSKWVFLDHPVLLTQMDTAVYGRKKAYMCLDEAKYGTHTRTHTPTPPPAPAAHGKTWYMHARTGMRHYCWRLDKKCSLRVHAR